ncbi:MAG: hypothetical protein NT062_19705 [Proteobacteria bacterium]|nr:hypothetical protein [Pseudomonadota bacterium]
MLRIAAAALLTAACSSSEPRLTPFAFSAAHSTDAMPAEQLDGIVRANIRSDETISESHVLDARGLGTTVVQVVAQSADDSRAFVVYGDGTISDTETYHRRETSAYFARFGRMSTDLFGAQAVLRPDERIDVVIWFNVDLPEPMLPHDAEPGVAIETFETWTSEHARAQGLRIASATEPMIGELRELGAEILEPPIGLPLAKVRLSAELLRSTSLQAANILRVEMVEGVDGVLLGHAGHESMRSGAALTGGFCGSACDGGLIDVGLWERAGTGVIYSGIATNNSRVVHSSSVTGYLHNPTVCTVDSNCVQGAALGTSCRATPTSGTGKMCVEDHLTWVAASVGMYGSYDYTTIYPSTDLVPNAPPGTTFPSPGAWHVDLKVGNDGGFAGLDYLVNSNAAPPAIYVNRSESNTPGFSDWAGRVYGTFFTAAGGNYETAGSTCGQLHNGLCVGMYDYETYNNMSTHTRTKNINDPSGGPAIGSSWINPVGSNLERPHVLGPGYHRHFGSDFSNQVSGLHLPAFTADLGTSSMADGFYYGSTFNQLVGTSFAAPTVLSAAIQAHQYEGWFSQLAYPMVNKAVLMASTRDSNADGAIGKTNQWSGQPSDAEDGMGQIDLTLVKQVLDSNYYFFRDMANSDFVSCGTNCREYTVVPSLLTLANVATRVALVWQSCLLNAPNNGPVLTNDLGADPSRRRKADRFREVGFGGAVRITRERVASAT